jgi:hypothetical protein
MTRPRRLYTTAEGKFYYLIDGKKKFVKAPAGVSEKQIARINIKNIVNVPTAKRIKRRKKRIQPAYGKKVGGVLEKGMIGATTEPATGGTTGGLPIYFFKPKRNIPTLDDQAEASADTTITKLSKELLKGLEAKPSSSKIQPMIANEPTRAIEESKGEGEAPTSNLPKPRKPKGKTGSEPNIRKSELVKILTNWFKKNEEYPSLGEVNNSIKSKFMDVTQEEYNDALERAAEIIDEYVAGGEKAGFLERFFKGKGGDGLYNDEIEKIVKKRIKNYVPVIASDEINELPRYVARGDKRFGFVINTNPSTSDGSGNDGYRTGHWRAVYINNEDDYPTVEYFDPLAEGKMPPELIQMTRKIAMKMNPEMMFKYKQNMLRRQSKLTSSCGHHSIKFLDDRFNGVPYADATGYTDYMEQHSSAPDDSHDGEKDISKYIKKYESYI